MIILYKNYIGLFCLVGLLSSCVGDSKDAQSSTSTTQTLKLKTINLPNHQVLVYFESLPVHFGKVKQKVTTSISSEITDSVTQVNVKVLGEAPAGALGNLYAATGEALAIAVESLNQHENVAYVVDTATANALLLLDCAQCLNPGSNVADVQASFQVESINYIVPNTQVLF